MVGGPEHSAEGDLGHDFQGEVDVQKQWAAGVPGVVKSLQHGVGKMGLRRTIATLRILNQPDGFDCPGCAWPEPDEAHHAEFCENGVKAGQNPGTKHPRMLSTLEAAKRRVRLLPPRHDGFDTVATVQAMLDERVKVFVGMGGNFASSAPETAATHRA